MATAHGSANSSGDTTDAAIVSQAFWRFPPRVSVHVIAVDSKLFLQLYILIFSHGVSHLTESHVFVFCVMGLFKSSFIGIQFTLTLYKCAMRRPSVFTPLCKGPRAP